MNPTPIILGLLLCLGGPTLAVAGPAPTTVTSGDRLHPQDRKDRGGKQDDKQEDKKDRKQGDAKKKLPPHTHKYIRSVSKVWIKPETKDVVVGKDKKGRPIKKTVTVKPGRWETEVQQRCRCGAVKK